ncbi:MAG: hypothetical protein ABFR36_06675 [Acidobacteriota bacterium]
MKKTTIIIFAAILILLLGNCSTKRINLVRIPVKSANTINFLKYKDIAYDPVKVEKFPSEYDPGPSIDYFFLNELPKTLKRSVKRYTPVDKSSPELKEGDLLLVGGEISLTIKKRSVIDDDKEKKGVRVFVKIENWELSLNVFFRDAATGKDVFSKTIKESYNGADRNKPDYNFEFLFKNITERLVRSFMGLGRMEVRYLIK